MEKDFYDLLAYCWRSVRAASKRALESRRGPGTLGEDHVFTRSRIKGAEGVGPPNNRRSTSFLRLLPLTQAIAGLPDAEQGKLLNEGQMELAGNNLRLGSRSRGRCSSKSSSDVRAKHSVPCRAAMRRDTEPSG